MDNNQATKPLYIVTGATDAMGSVITQKLAEMGNAIVMACYNKEKAEKLASELVIKTRNRDITVLHLDLSSFDNVKKFVNEVKALNRPVCALINNASYISYTSETSPDGYEKTVQVNFLSTILLTLLMKPFIQEGGRVIFSTALGRRLVSIPYEFPAVNNFMPIAAYAQSKLALSLFSIYLSTVMRTDHICVNSVDPGLMNLSIMRLFSKVEFLSHNSNVEGGAKAMMRAIQSNDTGFIFKSGDRQIKASTVLKNREVFIKLCNDTMRLLKKHIG